MLYNVQRGQLKNANFNEKVTFLKLTTYLASFTKVNISSMDASSLQKALSQVCQYVSARTYRHQF